MAARDRTLFSYAEAETILARLHGVQDQELQRGAFRARLKNFKKFGIPLGVSPGSGQKIKYGASHIYQWEFCLELTEFGVDPTSIASYVKTTWAMTIEQAFIRAEERFLANKRRSFIMFEPRILSAALHNQSEGVIVFLTPFILTSDDPAKLLARHRRSCWFELTPVISAVNAR